MHDHLLKKMKHNEDDYVLLHANQTTGEKNTYIIQKEMRENVMLFSAF